MGGSMSRSLSFANTNTTPSADSNNNAASQSSQPLQPSQPSQPSQPRQATGTLYPGGYSSEPMMTYACDSEEDDWSDTDSDADDDCSFVSPYDVHLIRAIHTWRMDLTRAQQSESNPIVWAQGRSPVTSGFSTPVATDNSTDNSSSGSTFLTPNTGTLRVVNNPSAPISPPDNHDISTVFGATSSTSPPRTLQVVNGSDTETTEDYGGFFDINAYHGHGNATEPDNSIEPYGLPSGIENTSVVHNVPLDSEYHEVSCHLLANSGWNCMIDYPVSTSPRQSVADIRSQLRRFNAYFEDSKVVGQTLFVESLTKINTHGDFTPFSYTNSWQPRTRAMREMEGDEPLSPKSRR
jgi:hypothetical protein